MFWGMVLQNRLQYKLIVVRPFHISRASVPLIHNDMRTLCCPEMLNVGVYLHLPKEEEEAFETERPFQICNLTGSEYQVNLDLNFTPGECIMFSMGSGYCGHDPEVHMTGHFLDEPAICGGGGASRSQCSLSARGPTSRCLGLKVTRTESRTGDGCFGNRSRSRSCDKEGQQRSCLVGSCLKSNGVSGTPSRSQCLLSFRGPKSRFLGLEVTRTGSRSGNGCFGNRTRSSSCEREGNRSRSVSYERDEQQQQRSCCEEKDGFHQMSMNKGSYCQKSNGVGGTPSRSQCSLTFRGPKSGCLGLEVTRTGSRSDNGCLGNRTRSSSCDREGNRSRSVSYERDEQQQQRSCCEEKDGFQQMSMNKSGSCQKSIGVGGTPSRSQCSLSVRGPTSRCVGLEVIRTGSRSDNGCLGNRTRSRSCEREGNGSRSVSYERDGQEQQRSCCEKKDGFQQTSMNVGGSCQKGEDQSDDTNTCRPNVATLQPTKPCEGCVEVVCDTGAMKKKKKKKRPSSPGGLCW